MATSPVTESPNAHIVSLIKHLYKIR